MLVAFSGTPGTGKSVVSAALQKKGYTVFSANELAKENNCIVGIDKKRNSSLIDIDKLDTYVNETFTTNDLIIIEGHVAHLLKSIERVILLRCHPKELYKRLEKRGWSQEKIQENVEAEGLDIILCEAVELHPEKNIFEINTTDMTLESVTSAVIEIINRKFTPIKKYNIGQIDWSEEIVGTSVT